MKDIRLAKSPLLLAVALGFALWIIIQMVERALWVLVLVLLALILAAAITPLVRVLQSARLPRRGWRIPKPLAVMIIYVAGAVMLGLMSYVVGGLLFGEVVRLSEVMPAVAADLVGRLEELERATGIPSLTPSPEDIATQVQGLTARAVDAARLVGFFIQGIISFFFQLFFVLTLTLFLIVESERILGFWVDLFPPAQRAKVRQVSTSIGDKVGLWLLGQVAVATITGILAGIGAALLGLPYPVLIGVVTALLDLAPVVGPSLMVIPAFLLGLLTSPLVAVGAAVFFYALSQFDGNVLSPVITGRAVQLSPTLIIIAVPLGIALYGTIGALIAIPVAAALQVLASEVFLPRLRAGQRGPAEESEEPRESRPDRAG